MDTDKGTNLDIPGLFSKATLPTSKYDTYFPVYEQLFSPFKGRGVTVVEIGILGGGSLEVWREYFAPHSRIIGIDLNPEIKPVLENKGFEIFTGDQADPLFWKRFFQHVGEIDILIDDGGHSNLQTWTTFTQSLPHIRDGGIILVEDTHASYLTDFGNPSPRSFVSRAQKVCDQIHARSSRIPQSLKTACLHTDLFHDCDPAETVFSVSFYESLIAFHIDRRLCTTSTQTCFGDMRQLPNQSIPADYRHQGIWDPDFNRVSLVAKLQNLLTFLRRLLIGR